MGIRIWKLFEPLRFRVWGLGHKILEGLGRNGTAVCFFEVIVGNLPDNPELDSMLGDSRTKLAAPGYRP